MSQPARRPSNTAPPIATAIPIFAPVLKPDDFSAAVEVGVLTGEVVVGLGEMVAEI